MNPLTSTEIPETLHDKAAIARPVMLPRLLVVDDEADIRRLVCDFFDDTIWQVQAVGSLEEALERVHSEIYPVILCDVHMPGKSVNLVAAAKERYAPTQVIMFTGAPTIDSAREAIREGAYDYIPKPCGSEDLVRIVQRAYERFLLVEERDQLERENLEYARRLEELLERRTEQLRESELKYRAVFNRAVDAILLVNPENGCICDYNIAATRLLNVASAELNERPIRDFVGERFDEMLKQAKEPRHGEWRFERVRFRGPDEWERTAQIAAGKVEFDDGAFLQLVARDVTDHLELRERHERMELELLNEQRLAAIGLLVSGVAHNINTPLTGIYGAAQLIKMKHPDVEDIDGVITQVDRINGIIRNLMWKSRQEQDQSFQELDLNQLLIEELRFLEADLDFKHNVDRRFEFGDTVPTIMGRYSDFSMSVMNVVRNALDAMHGRKDRVLSVSTEVRDGDVRITVKDNGCGIPPEERPKIFVPFYTTKPLVGPEKSEQPTGTGLGLSTVQKLLAPYGARYEIESEVEVGTAFSICLPLAINAASARRQESLMKS
jgi:PAS domain S-box-containing protein